MTDQVGYRFSPTGEELINHYLKNKILGKTWLVDASINEINICNYDPNKLPSLAKIKSKDRVWYFFSPTENAFEKKHRMKRTTFSGFWKPTGKDLIIKDKRGSMIGVKKTLVYHERKSANGVRTPWVMHEYHITSLPPHLRTYVICQVKYKGEDGDIPLGWYNQSEPSQSLVSDLSTVRQINTGPEVSSKTDNMKKQCIMELSQSSINITSSSSDIVEDIEQSVLKESRPPLKLRFIRSPPRILFTNSRIDAQGSFPIIELVDTTTDTRVTMGSLSYAQLEIVALNADIAEEIWTTETFNQNILRSLEGKLPLLVGDTTVTLKYGIGMIRDITFTESSKWLSSMTFRLGAKAVEGGVEEAISEAFVCKDHPGGSYQKHYPPYPDSEVWRLENVAEEGLTDTCLRQVGIHTVKDLRRYLSISSNALPQELEGKITKNTWNEIVSHSMHCVLDESECYIYNSEAHGASLLLNSVYEVMKVSFDGITVLNTTDFTSTQQALLDNLKREAYENPTSFVPVYTTDFVSFLPRSSKNLQDAELSIGFPGSQSISVVGASSDTLSTSNYHDVVIRYGRGDISNSDLISHLRAAFCRKGISVIEEFDEVDAHSECSILIILLTSTYAPSNLLNILEHQQKKNRVVYPIFYRISPYDLISNTNNYERFFLQDEPKRWQAALKELTQIPGYTLTDKSESELIDEIVKDALKVLCSGDKVKMIGMDVQVEEILSLLESLDVRSIGIWGTVGIGKTTIAEEIFRIVSVQYETCVFLKDLHKEVEEKGHDAVREDFLSKVLEVEPHIIRISDIKTSFLRSRLQHKRVLVILDDVNDYKDVETVLGKLNFFGPGSRIIMTSRNRHVFVLSKTDFVYEVKPLDIPDSLLLLNRGTFHIGLSREAYRTLSLELVKFSNGNPQVLQFLSKTDREWNSLLQEIQKTSPMYIRDIFEKSCCGLDDNERSIFLDIACFFNGMDKDNVAMLLDGCGVSADVGFQILVDKSLLNISQHNMLDMLSFIQATGREIVRQESSDRPGDRSRLWNTKDIRDVFIDDTGTSVIEGIFLDMSNLKYDANPNVFEKMCNLRLLKLYCSKMEEKHGVSFPQGLEYLPRKLRLLHWAYYPLSSLPKSFNPENLVELNLSGSCAEKLWKGKKSLGKLKKMILSYSYKLTKIPRLSTAPNLEHIDLEGCHSLLSISHSISYLKKLVFLNLKDCSKLESIPSFVDLDSLEVLNLSGCSKLENFPEISPNVKELYMGGTMVQEIPPSIKNLVFLEILDLENSKHLKNLPNSICRLKHLETLNLSGCTRLDQFPDFSRRMKCLKFIDLSRTAIKEELHSSIAYLTALEELRFVNCSIVILPIGIAILVMSRGYLVLNKDVTVDDGIKGVRPPVLEPPIELQRKSWDFLSHFSPKSESVKRPSSSSFNNSCYEEESMEEAYSFTGSIITSWKKGQLLGRGSFGSVYEGISGDGYIYAVKEVSLLDLGSQAQECIQQLEGEIALLSQLQHLNIVQYHGTAKDESNLYIFLELVTQGSLLKLYQRYQFRDSVGSVYTRQILDGLKYLHDNGFIHRDIKCANILVDASGAIKLADFELGKFNSNKSCMGDPFWMAPEVINPKRYGGFGSPADIWSLGCTVLEMLTRQIPYSDLEPVQVLFRIGRGKLPEIPDTLTQDARDFIHSCLKVKPEERPSADELLKHPFVNRSLPSSGSGSGSASLPYIYNAKDWEELCTRKRTCRSEDPYQSE